jgi:hypothetical protein
MARTRRCSSTAGGSARSARSSSMPRVSLVACSASTWTVRPSRRGGTAACFRRAGPSPAHRTCSRWYGTSRSRWPSTMSAVSANRAATHVHHGQTCGSCPTPVEEAVVTATWCCLCTSDDRSHRLHPLVCDVERHDAYQPVRGSERHRTWLTVDLDSTEGDHRTVPRHVPMPGASAPLDSGCAQVA